MTGILSNFDNVDTFEEKDEILNAYIKQIVNNTDDSNSEETALQQLIEFALNNKKRDYKENILKHLEDQWEKFEAMYLKGSYEIRKNVIGLLLACTEDGYLPGKELLSFAMCRKNLMKKKKKKKNNKKKSKFNNNNNNNNNNYKKNIVVMDNDEYYLQAQIAVECANILISLILNKGQTQEQQYIYNKSEPLKAAAFLTLCELCKPTTYFSNKIDGQNIDIVQLTESFNISVNGLIDATLSTKLFEKIVLQKNNVSNRVVDSILNLIDILLQNSSRNFAKLRTAISKSEIVGEIFLPHVNKLIHIYMYNTGIDARHIIKEKRAAQSSILYSMRALAALTFKLKGAKEVIAKNDPTLHLLRISQIQSNPNILSAICKLHVNIEGGHGQNWRNNHNTIVQKLQTVIVENIVIDDTNNSRFQILMDCFYNGIDGLPINQASRAYVKMDNMFKSLKDQRVSLSISSDGGSTDKKSNDDDDYISTKRISGNEKKNDEVATEERSNRHISKINESLAITSSSTTINNNNNDNKTYENKSMFGMNNGINNNNSNAPVKFCCILSGQVMDDPIKHPMHDMHCDRSTLEIYKIKQEMKSKKDEVVFWPKSLEKDIPLDDVETLETDLELQNEIQMWRMENILKGSEKSSWPFGNDIDSSSTSTNKK